MGIFKKKDRSAARRPADIRVSESFKKGNIVTRLSFFLFGLGNIINKQIVRGILFLAIEVGYIAYMISFGFSAIGNFITLGTVEQGQTYNEALGIYEYTAGDNSMLCLLTALSHLY